MSFKKFNESVSDLQVACMNVKNDTGFVRLSAARKALFAAVRVIIVDALPIGNGPAIVKERETFLAKFDKEFPTE